MKTTPSAITTQPNVVYQNDMDTQDIGLWFKLDTQQSAMPAN